MGAMGTEMNRARRPWVGRSRPTPRMVASLVTVLAVLLGGALLTPASASNDFPSPATDSPWFGGDLDWENDDAERYTRRLGSSVSLLARSVDYPLTASSTSALSSLAAQAHTHDAVAVVSLLPTVALEELDTADAVELVGALNALTQDLDTAFLLRFAPEMNATWTTYGQRPTAYVDAFVEFADVVHARALSAATAWTPAYGGGYPFGGSLTAPVRGTHIGAALSPVDRALLDSNSDGNYDGSDDPYGAFFPGDEAVDWVGLSMLRYGADGAAETNTLAAPTEMQRRLEDTFEYPTLGRPSFYRRFAEARDKPMLLLTGAAYSAEAAETGGPSERAVKGAWLRRVLSATRSRPQIGAVLWFEHTREEPEVDSVVRWGLTSSPALGRALGRVLQAGELDVGPLPSKDAGAMQGAVDAQDLSAQATTGDSLLDRAAGTIGLTAVQVSIILLLTMIGLSLRLIWQVRKQRMRPPWD